MRFEYAYRRSSSIADSVGATAMSFSPDTSRAPTFFRGELRKSLEFREAISALHEVVVSDLRWKPKDRGDYQAWLAQQQDLDLLAVADRRGQIATELESLRGDLGAVQRRIAQTRASFDQARKRYFDYLYQKDRDAWFVLDPIITVHPDQIFFECFSQDESSYGRLAASYEVFAQLGERANGTTNVDYSQGLYDSFQKIRTYKTTRLEVDPSGFEVKTTAEEPFKEVKIDLPDTWVRGLLQVSSAMTLPATTIELHPMDVHNLCFLLRRRRELVGPRSLRFRLRPGQPLVIAIDPWGTELVCPRSRHDAASEQEIRVWGRRRLFVLERLIPLARGFKLFLLGTGLPTFWMADLGDLTFTLGLSGWTRNDWASASNFDLMATREDVDDDTRTRVFEALATRWVASVDEIAAAVGRERKVVASALGGWVQAGRAVYDLERGVYRRRELTREPLPIEELRFENPREAKAIAVLHEGKVAVAARDAGSGGVELLGRVRHRGEIVDVKVVMDADARVVAAECGCDFYVRNKLFQGPCEHMLAVRLAYRRGVSDVIEVGEKEKIRAARPLASAVSPSASAASPSPSPSTTTSTTTTTTTSTTTSTGVGVDGDLDAGEGEKKVGFWRRVWNRVTGKAPKAPPGEGG